MSVLIDGPRIVAVAPTADLASRDGARVVDAGGMTLMPGLIDCHDHMASLPGSMRDRAAISPSLAVLMTAETLKDTVLGGFTAIRDAGGLDQGVKAGVERGLIPGPRLRISVNILSQTGGQNCHIEPAGVDSHFPVLPGVPDAFCDGVPECIKRTREMILAGADWIKLCTTGGVSTPIGGPLVQQFSLAEVQAIVDTAHAAGKPVMCHAYGGGGAQIALDAGVDSIEHGADLSEAQLEQMVRQGTWLVPTFAVLTGVVALDTATPGLLPDYVATKARQLLAKQRASFQRALALGVKIALGTDAGGLAHGHNARELGFMVAAGMTPVQALVAGTSMAARCMGLGEETGRIAAGLCADLLLVDADPLADVTSLENRAHLRLIVKDGVVFKDTV
ncbi:MAG: amidohydrolase family protein [Candidatus Saccharibacteria bacterium]|nr:amidohydrolase family protein [Pseudorhodobacter sp.]